MSGIIGGAGSKSGVIDTFGLGNVSYIKNQKGFFVLPNIAGTAYNDILLRIPVDMVIRSAYMTFKLTSTSGSNTSQLFIDSSQKGIYTAGSTGSHTIGSTFSLSKSAGDTLEVDAENSQSAGYITKSVVVIEWSIV